MNRKGALKMKTYNAALQAQLDAYLSEQLSLIHISEPTRPY